MVEKKEKKEKKVRCGACMKLFKSNEEYLNHVCKKSGYKANTLKHFDALTNGRFSAQAKFAKKRGDERQKKAEKK